MRLICLLGVVAACGGSSPGDHGGGVDAASGSVDSSLDAYDGPSTTRTYQQTTGGYAGTKSVGISTYSGLGNIGDYNANGMTFADGQNDWCTGIDIPSGTYSEVWLLRFDDLGIAPGSQVVSASLTMTGNGDSSSGLFFAGTYLAVPWYGDTPESCAGCSNSPVGWRWANGSGAPWGALGAAAEGTDTIASKAFRLPATGEVPSDGSIAEYTTALDASVVQGWIDGANNGMRIVAGVTGHHMGYVQAQRNAGRPESMRPKLTIVLAE
jgi:hypothetical protein